MGWVMGVGALALVGVLMGGALVLGELQAFWVGLSLIAAGAVLYDFRIGAVLLILMLPIGSSTIFPRSLFGIQGLNPLNLVLFATLGSFILGGLARKTGAFLPPRLLWMYLVPIVLAGLLGSRSAHLAVPELYENLAIHFTDARGYLAEVVAKPVFMVLIALLVAAAVARSKKPERFLVPIGVAMWILGYLAISRVARTSLSLSQIADPSMREFFSALGMHANDLGRLYAVAYALLLFAWAESKERNFRLACLATMAVMVTALVFTFSRGAFAGFLVVNALFLLWRFNMKTAAIVVVAGVAFLAILPPEVFLRLSMGFEQGDADAISAGRIDGIWLPLLPELLRSPLWGNGLGSVMWSAPMEKGLMSAVTHPHNAYLELVHDMGVLGFVLVIGFFAHVWKNLRALGSNAFLTPELRGFYKGAAAGLVAFFVTGIAGSSFVPRPEYAFLWIAIGMMYGQLARRPTN
jgi:O-antigen ligase